MLKVKKMIKWQYQNDNDKLFLIQWLFNEMNKQLNYKIHIHEWINDCEHVFLCTEKHVNIIKLSYPQISMCGHQGC